MVKSKNNKKKLPKLCKVTGIEIYRRVNRMKLIDIITILDIENIRLAKTYYSYTLEEVQSIIDTFSPKDKY